MVPLHLGNGIKRIIIIVSDIAVTDLSHTVLTFRDNLVQKYIEGIIMLNTGIAKQKVLRLFKLKELEF